MGDERTTIYTRYEVDVEEAIQQVEALNESLGTVVKTASAIVDQFEKLGKTHINVNNINPNQSQYKVGRNNFVLRDSKEDKETKTILNKQLEKANEAELQATIAHTNALNADTEKIKKQTEQADAVLEVRQRNSETNKKNSENRSRYLDKNMNWYKYRDEHPEMFVSRSSQPKYQWGATLSEVGHTISGLGGAGARIGGDLTSVFGMALKNGPLALATQGISKLISGIADLGKASLQAYSEIETLKTGLSIISPTQAQADSLFRDVAGYATRSPYGVAQSTELVTLLKQSGVNDSELMSTLTMLGDTAGGNMEKLKRIANNYAQIVSIGKASMLDMRQFAYAGIPIFEAVSKELGVTQQALREMISDGKVTSDVVEKVFKDLTSANGIFANATEIGAKTFAARKQNLADTKQLALSSMGEVIINKGIGGGLNLENEGFGRTLLSISERFYEALNKWSDNINLERSLENINKKDDRVEQLEALIAWNEANGNNNIASELKKELAQVLAFSSFDEDMSNLSRSYDKKTSNYEGVKDSISYEEVDKMKKSDIKRRIKEADANLSVASSLPTDYYKTMNDDVLRRWRLANGDEFASLLVKNTPPEELISLYQNEVNFWKQVLRAKNGLDKLTDEEKSAHYGTSALKIQQGVSDTSSKNLSSNPDSIYNIASQITQLYKNSEEYEKKQLEEQKELWSQAQKTLLDIRKIQDKQGIVDYSKSNAKDLLSYFENGAITEERKLTVRKIDDLNKMASDRVILTKQYQTMIGLVKDYMSQNSVYDENVNKALDKFSNAKFQRTPAEFFDNFSKIFSDTIETIDKSTNETNKDILSDVKTLLTMATLQYSSDTSSADYDPDKLLKGKGGQDFIPLWKRLLGGLTGISPTAIDSTKGALTAYRDDIAIRNTTSGVLKAGLQSGLGVDFVQSILKTSGEKGTAKGTEDTYQIDWKKTGDAVKKFAFELSNSTQVISAYKEGLQNQLSVYEAAMSDILVATENQMTDKDGHTSAAAIDKMPDNYKEQLLNAFGEELISDDGLKVDFKDGKFIDENGNQLSSENVRITGNIFEFIKEELPKLREEIANASIEENKRSKKESLVTSLSDIAVFDEIMSQGKFSQSDERALLDDREFVMKDFYQQLSKQIESYNSDAKKYGTKTTSLTTADVMDIYYSGGRDSEGNWLKDADIAFELFYNAVPKTIESLQSFLNSDGVRNLLEQTKQARNARSAQETANMLNQKTNLWGYTEEEQALDATKSGGWSGFYHENFFSKQLGKLGVENTGISIDDVSSRVSFDTAFNDLSTWQINKYKNQKGLGEEDTLTTSDFTAAEQDNITDQFVRSQIAAEAFKKTLDDTRKSLTELGKEGLKDAFLIPFEKLGEYAAGNGDAIEDMGSAYKQLAGSLMSNIGPLLTNVGLELASSAIADKNYGLMAAGLAIAAAGGFVGAYGGALGKSDTKKDNDSEYDKLKNLKGDLQDLLEQARKDAAYYEKNLRHKEALGILDDLSHTSVNDAIIAPNGNVITTHPDDYLIATKTPQSLGSQAVTVKPVVNNIVNNNARVNVSQETKQNDDGSVDIITTIEEIVSNYITSPRSDDAFSAREGRKQGIQAVM